MSDVGMASSSILNLSRPSLGTDQVAVVETLTVDCGQFV